MKLIQLSPSKLGDYNRCTRCFHDAHSPTKVPKPRGIFPSLPGGMDLIMKNFVDNFRGDMPLNLKGQLPGVLFDNLDQMNKWRHWRSGPTYIDDKNMIKMIGALDDCLVDDGIYIPLDWKTKGSKPKDSGAQYYQTQLDCYNLMLSHQGLRTRDEGYLVYIYPILAEQLTQNSAPLYRVTGVRFGMDIYKLECSKERARELVTKAAECLRGPRPKVNHECEHCNYLETIKLVPESE